MPAKASQLAARVPPPEAWEPLRKIARTAGKPLERFLRIEAAGGIVLIVAAALALAFANSPWAALYARVWDTPLGIRIGGFSFERTLSWVVNDCLMVLFFFVVGLEIRREVDRGELSEWRRAALPMVAAVGGMLAPAAIYVALAGHSEARPGWGVPMATDIAFAVGVLAVLGRRVPAALRVLLLALAVIDDLGAILVIALFYSAGLSWQGALVALVGLAAILLLQRFGVRNKLAYVAPAVMVWAGIYSAGAHPTLAGVLVGWITPVRSWLGSVGFQEGVQAELEQLRAVNARPHTGEELLHTLDEVDFARKEAVSPSEALIHALHPWVAYGILPLFALANAGVRVERFSLEGSSSRVLLGAALGLVVGKPLGILVSCWLAIRVKLAALPRGLDLRQLTVLGLAAGIGFTMSLFVAQLAFSDLRLLNAAKLGVLLASAGAGVLALLLGALLLPRHCSPSAALTPDEAEASTEV